MKTWAIPHLVQVEAAIRGFSSEMELDVLASEMTNTTDLLETLLLKQRATTNICMLELQ